MISAPEQTDRVIFSSMAASLASQNFRWLYPRLLGEVVLSGVLTENDGNMFH